MQAASPKINRKMTESSQRSSRKIEVHSYSSGVKIVIPDAVLSKGQIETIRDQVVRYLKYEESYTRLRPVDLQILNEYTLTVIQFVKEISEKRELLTNLLLHMFFYRNAKYIKQAFAIKNSEDDKREFHRLLVAHKSELNSQEVRSLLVWLKDYLDHYSLLYFKAESDGGLDIVYNIVLDVPTYVPPLSQANFIPIQKRTITEQDSEEEELFARRNNSQRQPTQVLEEAQVQLQQETVGTQPGEFDEYIEQQVLGVSSQCFRQLDDRNRTIIEQIEVKKKK